MNRVLVAVAAEYRIATDIGRKPIARPQRLQRPLSRCDLLGLHGPFGSGDLVRPWQSFPVRGPAVASPSNRSISTTTNTAAAHNARLPAHEHCWQGNHRQCNDVGGGTKMKVAARPANWLPSASVNRTATITYQLADMIAMAMVHDWCRYRRQICHQPTGSSADTTRAAAAAIIRLLRGPPDVGGPLACPERRLRKL